MLRHMYEYYDYLHPYLQNKHTYICTYLYIFVQTYTILNSIPRILNADTRAQFCVDIYARLKSEM